jgi:hypothetical protein
MTLGYDWKCNTCDNKVEFASYIKTGVELLESNICGQCLTILKQKVSDGVYGEYAKDGHWFIKCVPYDQHKSHVSSFGKVVKKDGVLCIEKG